MERVKTRCCAACRDDCRLPVPPAPSGPAAGNTALGGASNPLRSAKTPLSGRENLAPPPASGRGKLASEGEKFVPGGGVPLGCPPAVEFFSPNFRQKKSYAEFFAHRSAFFAARIRCRLFRQKNVFAKLFRAPKRVFSRNFSRVFRRVVRALFGGPAAAPRGPPPGARASA